MKKHSAKCGTTNHFGERFNPSGSLGLPAGCVIGACGTCVRLRPCCLAGTQTKLREFFGLYWLPKALKGSILHLILTGKKEGAMDVLGNSCRKCNVIRLVALLFFALCLTAGPDASACSNVFVGGADETTGVAYAAVARTMDIEEWIGEVFGYGLMGEENVSNINIPQSAPLNPMQWTNAYGFIGQTVLGTFILTDGVNTEGLYGGLLELPGFTQYPEFNPRDGRPELGVMEVITYALGTAGHVLDLVDPDSRTGKLLDVQMVLNAMQVGPLFTGFPCHLVFRDKKGNSAVVEWVEGKTHFYVHRAGTSEVIEIIDGDPDYWKVYDDTMGAVLTNAPTFGWHLQHVEEDLEEHGYFTGNTGMTWNGAYMNGSGLFGLPGDYTPVSRFLRASILARLYPEPKTQNQAMYASYSVLQSIIVPLGANPSPTAWVSWVDLQNSIYHFKPLLRPLSIGNILSVGLAEDNLFNWQSYDCRAIVGGDDQPPEDWSGMVKYNLYKLHNMVGKGRPPEGWVHVRVHPKDVVPDPEKIRKEINKKTEGNLEQEVFFVQ